MIILNLKQAIVITNYLNYKNIEQMFGSYKYFSYIRVNIKPKL